MENRQITNLNQLEEIAMTLAPKSLIIPGGDRLFLLTDPGVTVDCNFERMTALVNHASDVAGKADVLVCPAYSLMDLIFKKILRYIPF